MSGDVVRAGSWAVAATAVLGVLIALGSRNLAHFDAALVGYTFATLAAWCVVATGLVLHLLGWRRSR